MAKNIITRKIQLFIDSDKKEFKDNYAKLRKWNEIIFRAANHTATHQYFQENISEFFYLHDDFKITLKDRIKAEEGILTTSRPNTTYQVNSKKFKGEAPMASVSAINNLVTANISKERKEYFSGKRALRTYRRDIPMPLPTILMRNWSLSEDSENYKFEVWGIPFRTHFGYDFSNNRLLMEEALKGIHSLCDSSIQLKKKKIFLLAVFEIEKKPVVLDVDVAMTASLSLDVPIVAKVNRKELSIGTKDEFLYGRISIQEGLRRAQRAARFNKGGKGRKRKLQATERFSEEERHYVQTKLHSYSKKLVDLCVAYRCGKLILVDQKEKEEEAKDPKNQFLLRNWSYHGLINMIQYKCKKFGIELLIQ